MRELEAGLLAQVPGLVALVLVKMLVLVLEHVLGLVLVVVGLAPVPGLERGVEPVNELDTSFWSSLPNVRMFGCGVLVPPGTATGSCPGMTGFDIHWAWAWAAQRWRA